MALPTIQDLENLFPQLKSQVRGLSNKSQKGQKFTERELADSISSLLTKTKSVNASRVKQTAVAAGDNELLQQTEALEALVEGGILTKMEEFLNGELKAGQTDDLIDQFNELNDVITNVTQQSPIAISRMIRAQVSTLRSNKTSATRKATAVQNFQKVSGTELTSKNIEDLIQGIEDGTENVDQLAMRMEMAADDNDRMVQADNDLTMSLQDLINGVESGLIETDNLSASIADIVPLLEESSLANSDIATLLQSDPSLEVLKDMLEAIEGQDLGNIDKEKRKELNLGEDGSFRDKVSNLTPDIVKDVAEEGKGFFVNLLKGGAILALLGSTGLLTQLGKILIGVGELALNFFKETVAPKIVEVVGNLLDKGFAKFDEIGGFNGTQKEEVGNIVDFFVDRLRTQLTLVSARIGIAFRKLLRKINPLDQSSLPIRDAFIDARTEAIETGRYVVFRDEDGQDHLLDFDGNRKLDDITSQKAQDLIKGGAIDRRAPENVGDFGGTLGELDQKKLSERQEAFRRQIDGTLSEGGAGLIEIVIGSKNSKSAKELESLSASRFLGGKADGTTGGGLRSGTTGGGNREGGSITGRPRKESASGSGLSPAISQLGKETELLNVNPGAQ